MESQKEPNPNYLPYPSHPQSTDDEIDLRELFNALWKDKWIILAATIIFGACSVAYSLNLPNIYKSDALLAPAESSNGGGLSKMASQLGGLAALAGVDLTSGQSSQADLAFEVMKSREFIKNFIENHNLKVPLIAATGWEVAQNTLTLNEDIYNAESEEWLREPKGLRGKTPTTLEAVDIFKKNIFSVSKDKDSGLYIVSIKYYSPYIAQQWVTWLIEDINRVMRTRSIEETKQNLTFLNEQLQQTAVAEMQSTFYKLIEEQTKSLMLAEVQDEFVFKTIDPAVVPEIKDSPKRALICILGTLFGLILGLLYTATRFFFAKVN